MTDVVVGALEDRESLLADWRRLYASSPVPSFFLSPAWLLAWAGGNPAGAATHIVRGLDGERLILLGVFGAPAPTPLIGPRSVRLAEYGIEAFDSVYIEDNDFLIAPDAPEDMRERALAAVADTLGAEEIVLRNSARALAEASARFAETHGWRRTLLRVQPVYALDLNAARAAGDGALGGRSAALRSKMKRAQRRYEERGLVALRVARSEQERLEAWRNLIDLHQEAWRSRGEAGAFSNPHFIAFHERLQKAAPEATQLVQVSVAGEPIGCLYNFLHRGRVLNYQSGFRFEEDNQLTPGLLTHALAMQHYLGEGYEAYDFLAGEAEYKKRLGEPAGALSTIVLEKPGRLRTALRSALKRLRRAALRP